MNKKIKVLLMTVLLIISCFSFILKPVAASARISVSSSTSKVVVGNTFTVTVKVSSSVALGSWEYTISYDTKVFKLMSGETSVAHYGNGSKKSATYTYKFKAISSGSGKIGVKSYAGYDWNEKPFSMSAGSVTVSTITQAELEANYSKNNNLRSISIDGYTLTPDFNKNTTSYRVELGSNIEKIKVNAKTEDSKARVTGTGEKEVSEGENKIELVVTAENGATKTYTIIANVIDPTPITVKDVLGNELVVIKRESNLEKPNLYESKEININNQVVPGFYNEINKITLVGLKDNEGNIGLYIYNEQKNTFSEYQETTMDQLKILPLEINKEFEHYKKYKIKLDEVEVDALKISKNSTQSIIFAKNLETGEDHYYMYDELDNTITRYNDELITKIDKRLDKYFMVIIFLCAESIIMFIIVIALLISRSNKNKKKRLRLIEEKEKIDKKKLALEIKEDITSTKKDKKKDKLDDKLSEL